jgi:hypothetical protein
LAGRERAGRKGLIVTLVGIAVIVALGLAALLIFGMGDDGGRSTATAVVLVVTNTPEDTPVPTATEPLPTDTSPPPTVTPSLEPTATLLPPATSTSLPTDTARPTETDTRLPTDTPQPTATETPKPTDTSQPTDAPTQAPTHTAQPTSTPTSPPAVVLTGKIAYSVGGTMYAVDVQTKGTLFTVSNMRQPNVRSDGAELLADGLADPATLVNINAKTGAFI